MTLCRFSILIAQRRAVAMAKCSAAAMAGLYAVTAL
jgi:hypothetical protein